MLPLVGWRLGEVVGLVRLDHVVLIGLPHPVPFLADLRRGRARLAEMLGAGDLRGLAEARRRCPAGSACRTCCRRSGRSASPVVVSLSPHLVDTQSSEMSHSSRCSSVAHCRYSLATREALATVSMSPLPSMPKPVDRLAGLGDAVDHALGPAVLDADHHHGGDVRVGAGADQRAEMQVEILAELQTAIGVRQRQRALDVVGDRLAGGVGEIVERQDRRRGCARRRGRSRAASP